MKKIKIASFNIFLILLILPIKLFAEPQVHLDFKEQPNREVKTIVSSSTEIIFEVKGNEEIINKNRERGIEFPFKINNYQRQVLISKTGAPNRKGRFSYVKEYIENAEYSEDADGNRIQLPTDEKFVGLKIYGEINAKGELKKVKLKGGSLSKDEKKGLKAFLKSNSLTEEAPKHSLKIGDKFKTSTPMQIPVAGLEPVNILTTTTYKLKSILNGKAYFTMRTDAQLSGDNPGFQIRLGGGGNGEMIYDIENINREKHELNMEFEMIVIGPDVDFFSKMKINSTSTSGNN